MIRKIILALFTSILIFVQDLFAADLPKVLFIGDNLNSDCFPFLKKGLERTFVVKQKQIKVLHDTENRWNPEEGTSREVLAWLRDQRIKNSIHVDVLLFNCGQQDIRRNPMTGKLAIGLEEYRSNLLAIISRARKMKMEPLWFNTIPVSDSIHKSQINAFYRSNTDVTIFNQAAEEVMAREKVNVVDFNTFCKPLIPGSLTDAEHLNKLGQQRQGEYLAEALNQWWTACSVNNPAVRREKIWAGLPPAYEDAGFERLNGSARIDHVSIPEIERFLPKKRKSATAVIFFPGGGYRFLGFLRNGKDLADKLDSLGIAVIGLKYRTARSSDIPLLDAQRAVRYVRAHAKEWGINPNRIGVAGQSAGANLVLNLAGNYSNGTKKSSDRIERESSRPDFMAVFSSWNFGSNESPFIFKPDTPPFFIRHAKDDSSFKLILKVVSQLDEIGVAKNVSFPDKGGHGAFELDPRNAGYKWPVDFVAWLHQQKLWDY